jgi:hypothetical protein
MSDQRSGIHWLAVAVLAAALFVALPAAQQVCTVTANSTDFGSFERSGGPGLIKVNASTPTCAWTASPTVPWITIVGPTTGTGPALIPYEVAPMPTGTQIRSGSVNIGSSSVTVSQGLTFFGTSPGVTGLIEAPTNGAVLVSPFTVHGWAMADNGTTNTAVVDVYAATAGSFSPQFLGGGNMGEPRQHIADRWGPAYLGSGYSLDVSLAAAPGPYRIFAYAKSAPNSFYWDAGSIEVTVAAPALSLNVPQVRAAVVHSGTAISAITPPQPVIISRIGRAPWTAVPQQPWIAVAPASGTGDGRFTVSFDPAKMSLPVTGTLSGTIRVTATGVPGGTIDLPVFVTVYQTGGTDPPFGAFESPADTTTPLSGAFAISGWALDDIGVQRVQIYRDPVTGEGSSLVYIGDAPPVEGARPDVAAVFPTFPSTTSAGWGYMLLSNMLPNQGTGTFKLYAYAVDADGKATLLGSKTVTVDNATAALPFGTLDFPAQGEVVSGLYTSQGWVLTPQPAALRPDGSVCAVFIDGQFVGRPLLGQARPDVGALFPGLYNTSIAGGKYTFDTRHLNNGVHTIAWSVRDTMGRVQGIGSRYFVVNNP